MANLKQVKDSKAHSMGLHKEVLTGRTQQVFFNSEEAENFFYYGSCDVDFNKRTEVDTADLSCKELNGKLNSLIEGRLWNNCCQKSARKAQSWSGNLEQTKFNL